MFLPNGFDLVGGNQIDKPQKIASVFRSDGSAFHQIPVEAGMSRN